MNLQGYPEAITREQYDRIVENQGHPVNWRPRPASTAAQRATSPGGTSLRAEVLS